MDWIRRLEVRERTALSKTLVMGVDLGIKLEKQCCIELTVTNWIWSRDKTESDIEEEVDNTVYWLVCYYGLMPPPPAHQFICWNPNA